MLVLPFVQVASFEGLIPHPKSRTVCVKDQETEKAAKVQNVDAEP
jgi:hypothetical protein